MITDWRRLGLLATSFVALGTLSACGGGSSGGSSGGGGGLVTVTPTPSPTPTPAPFSSADASRLARQATFGATPETINRMVQLGVNGWLDEQFAATGSDYSDLATSLLVPQDYCNTGQPGAATAQCSRNYFSREPVARRFYANAMNSPDQLRQRIAFALSQILVASETEVNESAGIAAYQQILLSDALGNYRDILRRVTTSGYMGDYLDMADSNRTAPSENYARELLQLFSMGADQLNMDGTPKLDATGAPLPNYDNATIREVARALTGWTYARIGDGTANLGNIVDYTRPMQKAAATRFDSGAKSFFGTSVSASASPEDNVAAVIDAAFNNASTAPYISKQLIQHLVTANPSPAYVGRVSAVFANNGSGIRGDMKAVVRAILTDSEARGDAKSGTNDGKVAEPVLAMTRLARAIGMSTDGYPFVTQDNALAQPVFRSPSVFNFYPPDYPLQGSTTLKSPASKLMTSTTVLRIHNLIYSWTVSDANQGIFTTNPQIPGWTATTLNWGAWEAMDTDTDAMIARINLLFMNNTMTDAQKAALKNAAAAITNTTPAIQARRRAQMMLYIVATSPQFLVER